MIAEAINWSNPQLAHHPEREAGREWGEKFVSEKGRNRKARTGMRRREDRCPVYRQKTGTVVPGKPKIDNCIAINAKLWSNMRKQKRKYGRSEAKRQNFHMESKANG